MIPCGSFKSRGVRQGRQFLLSSLACGVMLAGLFAAPAGADDLTCDGIKRALVSANLAVMRIERGPLPLAAEQAAVAVGQMTALEKVAPMACSLEDAAKITAVVTPRVEALQRLLPAAPTDDAAAPAAEASAADTPPAPDQAAQAPEPATAPAPASGVRPPAPPVRPPKPEAKRSSVSAATCVRNYYTKDGHRRWRCKR
jgi:hypothetical protein